MPWREALQPVRMQRVALVAPRDCLRDLLVRVADAGIVEPDETTDVREATGGEAGRRLQRLSGQPTRPPALLPTTPDLDALEAAGRADLLAGEAQLEHYASAAVTRRSVAALAGWTTVADVVPLARRLAEVGGAVVPLARPRGVDPPTLLVSEDAAGGSLAPLIKTYATVPYADVDPTLLAGLAYVFMFGMMFGDVGHGALLVVAGMLLRSIRWARLARVRRAWPFVMGAGAAAMAFGLLYGEFFGPTGVVPVLWLAPLDEPVTLMGAAVGVGGVLLAGAYALGTVNRWREGGWPVALYAPSGVAGVALFLGLGVLALGAYDRSGWLVALGGVVWVAGLAFAFTGLWTSAGGGGAGAAEAGVRLFDTVIRVGSNLVSFARLAAFGLTHAALGAVVWRGTVAAWGVGGAGWATAVLLFTVGNALAFSLEALVAGVQALRLEYYELFSRVFWIEGRPFRPWHVPIAVPAARPVERLKEDS